MKQPLDLKPDYRKTNDEPRLDRFRIEELFYRLFWVDQETKNWWREEVNK